MTGLNRCVLVVEDHAMISEMWCLHMEIMGLEVCGTATTADDAIDLAAEHRPAIVLMDVRLIGEKDGVDAAMAIHDAVGSKVIFITGSNEPSTIARIEQDHPAAVLIKPVADHLLRSTVEKVVSESGVWN